MEDLIIVPIITIQVTCKRNRIRIQEPADKVQLGIEALKVTIKEVNLKVH